MWQVVTSVLLVINLITEVLAWKPTKAGVVIYSDYSGTQDLRLFLVSMYSENPTARQLGLENTSTAFRWTSKTPLHTSVLDMTLNYLWWRESFLELWRLESTASLPLLPGPLWVGVVEPVRVPSTDQIEICNHWTHLTVCKQITDVKSNY